MAVYFTFAIECYQEEDAVRLAERLRPHVIEAAGHKVPMARVWDSKKDELWYVWATPQGPGYSEFGYGEGLNETNVICAIVENLYGLISGNTGVRRAMCGYEGQDAFCDSYGGPNLDDLDTHDLVYDMMLGPPRPGAREFGASHYWNPPNPWYETESVPRYRLETEADADRIEVVTAAAFLNAEHTSHTEQFIVAGLRKAGVLTLSMVAEKRGEMVGHGAVSPVVLSDGSTGWYGLGPVSVLPEHQRLGIGSVLIREVLGRLREMGASGCVVLGDPRYYERFGFKVVPGLVLPGVPPEYFMALAFGAEMPQGSVAYHAAFDA